MELNGFQWKVIPFVWQAVLSCLSLSLDIEGRDRRLLVDRENGESASIRGFSSTEEEDSIISSLSFLSSQS